MIADLQAWGAPDAVIDQYRAQAQATDQVLEVPTCNATAIEAFTMAATQWRVGGMGAVYGLDYTAAAAAWQLAGLTVSPEDFWGVQVMEAAFVREIADRV